MPVLLGHATIPLPRMREKEEAMTTDRTFLVNDVFYTLQGEGMRAGEPSVFVRFAKCNLACTVEPGPKSPGGFDCDTEFESGRRVTYNELLAWICSLLPDAVLEGMALDTTAAWLVLTGGEPGLQIDHSVIAAFHAEGFMCQVESNGTVELPGNLDWITVSPKVAEHALTQLMADEVKYVRGYGQPIPKPRITNRPDRDLYRLLSPAFAGEDLDKRALAWCVDLVKKNPGWRLSTQNHKWWRVR